MHCDILELERLRNDLVQTCPQILRSLKCLESDFGLCGQSVKVVHRSLCVGSFLPVCMVSLYLHFYLERDSWLQGFCLLLDISGLHRGRVSLDH